jgi:acyl-CoA thioester hydrolase
VRVECAVQLRWADMDAMRHVNNATYLTYLETAREPWFEEVLAQDADGMRFVLRRLEIDYLSQLTFADGSVLVTVELDGLGRTSIRTRERITAESDGRVVAEAVAIVVHLDESLQASAPLPEALRERLAAALPA